MQDDLVPIYEAATLTEAKLFSDLLATNGIPSHLDNVDSPLDGLIAGEQTIRVMVLPDHESQARKMLDAFLKEQASG